MKLPERMELLERYHDGEVSKTEATEVEALLAHSESGGQALGYLGALDNLGEMLREADAHAVNQVSFEGLWDNIAAGITPETATQAQTAPEQALAPARFELLERYHDGEVSSAESAEVEAMLQSHKPALDYLGGLDNLGELLREADADQLAQVSFEGLWDNVQSGIAREEAATAKAQEANKPSFGERLGAWFHTIFIENKSAWISAAAAAAAVILVMSFMNDKKADAPEPGVANVIEKHYIYVDSVDKANPDDMVVVNSMQDDNTAVIWLLPDGANAPKQDDPNTQGAQPQDDKDDGSVEIEEEPL